MKTKTFLSFFCLVSHLFDLPSFAGTTLGPETVNFGPYSTSNWHSDDFKGMAERQWDDTATTFCFTWRTATGDQIGRIGLSYPSKHLGQRIDELSRNCVMSTNAVDTTSDNHWFYWSIYGWTHDLYTYWGNTPRGWDNEFYVIFYTDKPRSEFLKDPGCQDIGSLTVDGATFDCYVTPATDKKSAQWLAVRRDKTWKCSVNLKKIFDYWRSKGLGNEYIVDLGWALEGFEGSTGKLQLADIKIPNLALPTFKSSQSMH